MPDITEEPCYYIDTYGNEHRVYPLKLIDFAEANRLFGKLVSEEYAYLNAPMPKLHTRGKLKGQPIIKDGEPELDYTSWNALMKLLEMALQVPQSEFEKWIDLKNIVEILDEYRQVSQIKKKIEQQIQMEILQQLSQP